MIFILLACVDAILLVCSTGTSKLLDPDGVQNYQSIIGSLQWAGALVQFDIATAVMTLSSLRSLNKGHLERAQRVCSYQYRMKHGMIRFVTCQPDFSTYLTLNLTEKQQFMVIYMRISPRTFQHLWYTL